MGDDPDEIRRKRLQRLGGGGGASRPAPQSSLPNSSEKTGDSAPAAVKKPLVPLPEITAQPVSMKRSPPSTPRANQRAAVAASPGTTAPVQSPSTPATALAAALQFAALSDEKWEQSICESVLGVTLEAGGGGNSNLLLLETLVMEEGDDFKMTSVNWERVLYARLSMEENSKPEMPALFDYLTAAWLKVCTKSANIQKLESDPQIAPIAKRRCGKLNEFAGLIMNYVGLTINPEMIDMFPQNHEFGAGFFGVRLLASSDPESSYPRHFVDALISRFADEGLEEILSATVKSILTSMRVKRIYDDYLPIMRALMYLLSFKKISELITLLPDWSPEYVNARSIEMLTIMGPFLSRLSTFPDNDPSLPVKYFGSNGILPDELDTTNGIGSRNQADVKTAKNAMRDSSAVVQNHLHTLILTLIKAGPAVKENVLAYLARVIDLNQKRSRLQVNRAEVSTDGFMHNILQVCKLLCNPLLDANYSKLALIDTSYLPFQCRFDVSEETCINASKDAYDSFVKAWKEGHPNPGPANFVTEIFFITIAYHHLGLLSTIRYYKNFMKELEEMQATNDRYVSGRMSGQWDSFPPPVRANHEQGLARFQGEIDKLIGVRLAMEAALLDEPMLEQTIRFYDLVMMWLIKCATGSKQNIDWSRVAQGFDSGLPLFPLPENMSPEFISIPEWVIEDICDFYTFLTTRKPVIFENKPRNEFMTFSMVILSNPSYIKNPYLKSKIVEILFHFTLPLWRLPNGETRGRLDTPFIAHPLAKAHLIPSILQFYVDVEQTGMSSQFYDKFNIRFNISQILKSIWNDSVHRENIIKLSRTSEFFVKFVNLLRNDANYLMDECLSKLKEIGQLQTELATPPTEGANPQERQTRESTLAGLERHATTYVSLANETMHMLSYLTSRPEIVEHFMVNEIVGRLAAMLDYNLVALAGPRCADLKVKNPEKYRFDPRRLLNELTNIFLHLSHRPEFVSAVAKDGRSYSKEVFMRAVAILSKHALKPVDQISALVDFVNTVEMVVKQDVAEEEELGDVPEEFLDPLLFHLMEEPVLLPSGTSVDLSTIRAHLLSDEHDPFNRQPLKIEDVVPNLDLKSKIEAWKLSKRK